MDTANFYDVELIYDNADEFLYIGFGEHYLKHRSPDTGDAEIFINQFADMLKSKDIPSDTEDAGWLLEVILDDIVGWIHSLGDCEFWTIEQINWLMNLVVPACQKQTPNYTWNERFGFPL